MYTRARAVPVNPNTASQVEARAAFTTLSVRWSQTLDDAERDAWKTYAEGTSVLNALGDTLILSGQQMYLRNNSARLRAGMAVIDTAPPTPGDTTFTTPVITGESPTTLNMGFTNTDPWAIAVGGALLVQVSRQQSAAVNFFKGPFQLAGRINGAVVPPTSPAPLTPLPFTYTDPGFAFARFVAVTADGRISPPQILRFAVAAP